MHQVRVPRARLGVYENRARAHLSPIGTRVANALAIKGLREHFAVLAGDSLTVSAGRPYVRVTGAVNAPVAVPYVAYMDIEYYTEATGG